MVFFLHILLARLYTIQREQQREKKQEKKKHEIRVSKRIKKKKLKTKAKEEQGEKYTVCVFYFVEISIVST